MSSTVFHEDNDLDRDADNESEDEVKSSDAFKPEEGSDNGQDFQRIVKITQAPNASRKKEHASAATQDAKLKQFLANADEIESIEHFTYWKDEFLDTFRKYLNPDGTATAREADDEIHTQLERLAKISLDVKTMAIDQKITAERSSVKGQRAINEMISCLAKLEDQIEGYWPKTQEEEEVCGYTKFELAAVLVRDGFRVYGLMVATRDYIQGLSDGVLRDVLKPNQRSIIQFYFRCLESFTQTMADLGMYKLMQKCVEIYRIRPRKKKKKKFDRTKKDALSDSSLSDTINKGRMFQRSKKKFRSIMDHGWTSGFDREEIKAPAIGIDGGAYSGDRIRGADSHNENNPGAMSNLSREHDAISQEQEEEDNNADFLYYFDPINEIVGKVPRSKCLAEKVIFTLDENGRELAEGEIEEWDSKDGKEGKSDVIWKLKQLLRRNPQKKAEGTRSPPFSPRKKVTGVQKTSRSKE